MSSFQKLINNYTISGTKTSLRNGLLLTSTGNTSLDNVIGGGLPLNSILLIEEDKYCTYSNVLSKFFIAEGAVHEHGIFLGSLDTDPKEFITTIPMPKPITSDCKTDEQDDDNMRIAWRYNSLPKINTEDLPPPNLVEHYFDLNKSMDAMEISKLDILYFDGKGPILNSIESTSGFTNPIYVKCLLSIQSKLNSDKSFEVPNNISMTKGTTINNNNNNSNSNCTSSNSTVGPDDVPNILRICINSLGSPLWYDENLINDLCRFLTILKGLLRNYLTVTCITIPMHLLKYHDPKIMHRIRNLVDIAIELESFAGSDKETNPFFKDYHGLISIPKLGAINTLAPFSQKSYDLAFKIKRKKFIIEKLHLPPALQEEDQQQSQQQQQNIAAVNCGTTTKHLLEF